MSNPFEKWLQCTSIKYANLIFGYTGGATTQLHNLLSIDFCSELDDRRLN